MVLGGQENPPSPQAVILIGGARGAGKTTIGKKISTEARLFGLSSASVSMSVFAREASRGYKIKRSSLGDIPLLHDYYHPPNIVARHTYLWVWRRLREGTNIIVAEGVRTRLEISEIKNRLLEEEGFHNTYAVFLVADTQTLRERVERRRREDQEGFGEDDYLVDLFKEERNFWITEAMYYSDSILNTTGLSLEDYKYIARGIILEAIRNATTQKSRKNGGGKEILKVFLSSPCIEPFSFSLNRALSGSVIVPAPELYVSSFQRLLDAVSLASRIAGAYKQLSFLFPATRQMREKARVLEGETTKAEGRRVAVEVLEG